MPSQWQLIPLLVVIVIVAVSGCTTEPAETSAFEVFTGEKSELSPSYSLKYPKGWYTDSAGGIAGFTSYKVERNEFGIPKDGLGCCPQGQSMISLIIIPKINESETLEGIKEMTMTINEKTPTLSGDISDIKITTIGNREVLRYTEEAHTMEVPTGTGVEKIYNSKKISTIFFEGNYMVTFFIIGNIDEHKELYEEMLSGIELS